MTVIKLNRELRTGQSFDYATFNFNLFFVLGHALFFQRGLAATGFHISLALAATRPANGFLLLNATKFALRNVPAFAADRAQDTALGNSLAEALEQLFL